MDTNLEQRCREYLEIVDHGTEEDQGDKRTEAHEKLLDELEKLGIPFEQRYEGRWYARWYLKKDSCPKPELPVVQTMWARINGLNGNVKELYFTAPDDNKACLMPVQVVIMPLPIYKAYRGD